MIRINDFKSKTTLKRAVVVNALLLIAAAAFGQQQVNLTAGPATTTTPDGTVIPMWGYTCGAAVSGSTATCAPLSGSSSGASNGSLGGIYVLNGGSGYSSSPSVMVSAPTGSMAGVTNMTATANAVVSGGKIVGLNVTSHGAGYIAPPTITITDSTGTGAVAAASPAWSPIVITVPAGTATAPASLQINLTNNLSFTPAAGGTANNIPTSIVMIGQVGGGLGGAPTTTPSPSHANTQGCASWFIAALPPGTPCTSNQSGAYPPAQGPRVQSMGAEVAAVAPGTVSTTALTWAALKPGTYLLESGTHPSIQVPMGLIGMLVVTTAPSSTSPVGTAYPALSSTIPAVQYNAEVPLEFSEIDPVQNKTVDQAVRTTGFSETKVWSGMPIDPNTGQPSCGNPSSTAYLTCYPPAVNYTPFYFLINGLAFNRTNPAASLFAATAGVSSTTGAPVTTGISPTGTILVRMVNAGLRMHVPAIVGSQTNGFSGTGNPAKVGGFTLVAEDGNPTPDLAAPRVQTDVFMAAGKTYDVMINVPVGPAALVPATALPIFDRELSLSANSSIRDAGMLAYLSVNGGLLPVTSGAGGFGAGTANPDTYNSLSACGASATTCISLAVSDPSKGVLANDVNAYGAMLSTPPTGGVLTCSALPSNPVAGICANGTFTYTPNPGTSADSFGYCINGAAAGTSGLCTTVTLAATVLTGPPVANNVTYVSKMATFLKIASPGVLSIDTDPSSLPLTVVLSGASAPTLAGGTLVMDAQGGFTASVSGAGTATCPSGSPTGSNCFTFKYVAQNSQGRQSNSATVTLVFPPPSNLQVRVLDAQAYANCNGNSACIAGLTPFGDYRWIIEEDKTFYIDPNCTTNSSITTPGCPNAVGPAGQSTIPVFGVQFHTSTMDFVAQGCTGPLSCEGGQTMLDTNPSSPTYGTHIPAVCDLGNGACRPDPNGGTATAGFTEVNPSQVVLDPSKRYYISVLPGDAANPFPANVSQSGCTGKEAAPGDTTCGHTMSGTEIPAACNILGGPNQCSSSSAFAQPVNVLVLPTPLPTGKLSVIVFEDDYPLNGEQDSGGGNGTVAPIEPGLGGFNLVLWDTYGGLGDVTGQNDYDMFNMPLSNSLAGTIDPSTGQDACPISASATQAPVNTGAGPGAPPTGGVTGMIVTCPQYEADGKTLSPLAGQAIIDHLMPEKFSVQAYPAADRIARGEEWLQTNTLDGQHPHDAFIPIGGPGYFQEYGPAGYHVAIGFANPAIINGRHSDVCNGYGSPGTVGPCTNAIDGQVDVQRLSRIPDERLYPSGSRDAYAWTQCWVSLGDPDGEDFMFTKCDANGNFKFTNVPGGNWRLTIGDQWNDQIIDGLSTPANVGCTSTAPNQPTNSTTCPGGQTLHMGNIGVQQWQSNLYTRTFIDNDKTGIWDPATDIGIPFIYTMIHYRDGHNANALATDFNGVANFNETFPLFNWYVVEADSTRYKTTGIHTVYDAGGPADGSPYCGPSNGARSCGKSTAYNFFTNTFEAVPLPADLSVPGAVYCQKADCSDEAASFVAGTAIPSSSTASTGRIDPPIYWGGTEGWAGLTGQSNWIEIGKTPYAACPPACATVTSTPPGATTPTATQVGENGGIYGNVTYASTRPFDDASQMIQQPWEPNIPNVTVNLYQEGFAADGVTPTLTMVDTTTTSSWDAWAQGFYPNYTDSATGTPMPYMNCPGQGTNASGSPNQDLFYYTLFDQPNYLDWYNTIHSGGATPTALPYNSQFKCYDSMKVANQLQPAPYDGKYIFPSSLGINPATGKLVSTVGATNGVTASMAGTNCTICVANPDSTDKYRFGNPMLPPGKYVVQVVMPPGYEVYKEEDKNLLIGDNFIAPVTQQFAGLGGDIFILPDQASVASMYDTTGSGYNANSYQDPTTSMGLADELSGVPGFPGYTDPLWPCVGEQRVVPDFLSLFPNAQEVAPFAGATRPLCDRKEVTLTNQMAVNARFFLFTSTHIAAKFTGVITDDFTSEFDPFAPQFGEKFAPPNMPVSTKDYLGNEISRVYSDHWGTYDGLTFSSWDVNPPNITGYSPSMLTQCMNDPGPVLDTNPGSKTYGQMITDPLYNPAYSDFCYVNPFMPGLTTYNDTPVVPTEAFVGAGYNNVDCGYPDATPAVSEVDGDGVGPWVAAPGHTLVITALGTQQVNNSAYSGPSANVAPFNEKTVSRHYGFGSRCTAIGGNCAAVSQVTIGGKTATISNWSDTQITVTVPGGVSACAVQQQKQYQGTLPAGQSPKALCGELVITAGNGKQSIDAVTVTIGGKTPTHVGANASIQGAIDAAAPGDMIIVDPTCATTGASPASTTCSASALDATTPTQTASIAAHVEMLLMWKPVRLQGVGAATSVIDSNAFPAGKLLDPWRRHINCLFGLTLSGVPLGSPIPSSTPGGNPTPAPYDPNSQYSCPDTGWNYFVGSNNTPQVDRIPLEAVVGWDATLNGNLAEQLQEPSLMGAYEGAGITVLSKGVWTPPGVSAYGTEGAFPTGSLLLQETPAYLDSTGATLGPQHSYCTKPGTSAELSPNPYPSNFECNPSSIDGLTIRDSSQGGGGVFVHGWAHYLQIANNRIYNNAGTLSGGITLGQAEFPDAITITTTTTGISGLGQGEQSALDVLPSCQTSNIIGTHLPYCLDLYVNIHNNDISSNSSLGDELFSGTLSGGGGASFCTGSDYYKFNYNWVCGNQSSAEGGGITHLGFNYDGDIEHNSIVLNQSINPTTPTNGGGIMIMGTPDTDPTCTNISDADCPPGLSDGTGPGLVVNANLIQGNSADSGSGGGIRMQQVNGTDVSAFFNQPSRWNSVSITNNIINNNIAGWDGAGISLEDSLNVSIINNTISSNDTLASSGVLTQSIGTPQASAPAGNCVQPGPSGPTTASCPQSSGVTSMQNTPVLTTTFTGLTVTCPTGQPNCTGFSNPLLKNNLIWQNRTFYIGVAGPSTTNALLNQQNEVSLFDAFSGTAAPVQTASGQCSSGVSYWDIGVRGDTGPSNHSSGFTLNPTYSVLDDPADYPSNGNFGANPQIASQYCNGSRVPPSCTVADGCGGPGGFGVPPGIVDASTPNPVFSLTPSATVDEGNNWINVSWGPLALSDDSMTGGANGFYGGGPLFANYSLVAGSPAIDYVPVNSTNLPTSTYAALGSDFFGNPRPDPANTHSFDIGAVEYQHVNGTSAVLVVTPAALNFGSVMDTTTATQTLTLENDGGGGATGITVSGLTAPFSRPAGGAGGTCGATLAAGATCTIVIQFAPPAAPASANYSGSATITANVTVNGSPVALSGTGIPITRMATVSPSPLAFGSWASGTTSDPMNLTVTNTGNVALAGGSFTFGAVSPAGATFARVTTGAFPTGAPNCAATLAVGASCTIKITFAAGNGAAATFNGSITVAYTGATVTPTPVALTGSRVAARASVGISPNPLTITLPTGTSSGTGTVTLTNTAASGGSSVEVSSVSVSGGSRATYIFNVVAGTDTCTGANLAPGTSCTVGVGFTNVGSARGVNRAGTITFTDSATGSPQAGSLIGYATP